MNSEKMMIIALVSLLTALGACSDSPETIHDLSDSSYQLLNQDSTSVNFPGDFEGKYVIAGFIYTHCPDMCRVITANMKNIYNQLEDTAGVKFVGISFDPTRDQPVVLREYMKTFALPPQKFTLLTGDTASINAVLQAMDIEADIAARDTSKAGEISYTMNHTNRIAVMDPQGRVRFEYPGSVTPPDYIIEDLNKIR